MKGDKLQWEHLEPRPRALDRGRTWCWWGVLLPTPSTMIFKLKQTKSKARKTSWVDRPPPRQSGRKTTRNGKVHNLCPERFWVKGRARKSQLTPHRRGESSLDTQQVWVWILAQPLMSCAIPRESPHLSEHPFLIGKIQMVTVPTF